MKNGENNVGIGSRWYPETLARRIAAINAAKNKIEFLHKDAFDVIPKYLRERSAAFFVDPPYTAGGKSAGHFVFRLEWITQRYRTICREASTDETSGERVRLRCCAHHPVHGRGLAHGCGYGPGAFGCFLRRVGQGIRTTDEETKGRVAPGIAPWRSHRSVLARLRHTARQVRDSPHAVVPTNAAKARAPGAGRH